MTPTGLSTGAAAGSGGTTIPSSVSTPSLAASTSKAKMASRGGLRKPPPKMQFVPTRTL
jgi:hypothetical protein